MIGLSKSPSISAPYLLKPKKPYLTTFKAIYWLRLDIFNSLSLSLYVKVDTSTRKIKRKYDVSIYLLFFF